MSGKARATEIRDKPVKKYSVLVEYLPVVAVEHRTFIMRGFISGVTGNAQRFRWKKMGWRRPKGEENCAYVLI